MTSNKSVAFLQRNPRFARLIKKYGMPDFNRGATTPFRALVRAIIHQQVSTAAANSIFKKFVTLFGKFPTPGMVSAISIDKLRTAGLSRQKASYLKDLAQKFSDGTIKHRSLKRMTSEEVVEHLIQIKGIGVWSVHMFLIFTLNRPDVLPTGDLGIRKGFQRVYRLKNLPDHSHMEKLAIPWRTHASTASWYFWQEANDLKKRPTSD